MRLLFVCVLRSQRFAYKWHGDTYLSHFLILFLRYLFVCVCTWSFNCLLQ